MLKIDFNNIIDDRLQFYELREEGELIEYAYKEANSDYFIHFQHSEKKKIKKNRIAEFIAQKQQDYAKGLAQLRGEKISNRKPYLHIYILNKKLPLIIFLGITKPITQILKEYDIKYSITPQRDKHAPKHYEWNENFLNIFPKDNTQLFLVNGLDQKMNKKGVEWGSYDSVEPFHEWFKTQFAYGKISDIENVTEKIIDPITRDYFIKNNMSTDFHTLIRENIVPMLMNQGISDNKNMANMRLRMSEVVADIVYEELQMAISYYNNGKKLGVSIDKLKIAENAVIEKLTKGSLLQMTKTVNPIEELVLSNRMTRMTIGANKRNILLPTRDPNESHFGVYSPSTSHEYTNIGIVHALTAGATYKDSFGNMISKKFDDPDIKPSDIMSINELVTPFHNYSNSTRNVMGQQQFGQFLELPNLDTPLIQTGYEGLIPQLASSRFSKKSKGDGKITDIKDNNIFISYKDGSKEVVNCGIIKARTKRGIYLPKEYTIEVSKGQTIKKDTILAVTPSLKDGMLKFGKNIVVAEMSHLSGNFEDGWSVTRDMLSKYKSTQLEKIVALITPDVEVIKFETEVGDFIEPGKELISFKKVNGNYFDNLLSEEDDSTDEEENYIEEDNAKDDTSLMRGLKENNGGIISLNSPGGRIKDINIILNSDKIDSTVLARYKKIATSLKSYEKSCNENNSQESQKINCITSNENMHQLKVGGNKVNGVEFEGAVIEFYIEVPSKIRYGAKFTMGAYGAKGTIQNIIPEGETPVGVESGLEIGFIQTPLSIINRKNISLILNMWSGKIAYIFGVRMLELANKNDIKNIRKDVEKFYSMTDKTSDLRIYNSVKNKYLSLSDDKIIKLIKGRDPLTNPLFPVIAPPYESKININDLEEVAKEFNIPLEEYVDYYFEGEKYTTENKVPVGIMPIILTEHFPQAMSSVRAQGKNSQLTEQPLSGSTQGKGGIKIGLYDLAAINTVAGKAEGLLDELHSLRSDDKFMTRKMTSKIAQTGKIIPAGEFKDMPRQSATAKLIDIYFQAAGHSIKVIKE